MQVLEHHEDRLSPRESLELSQQRLEGLFSSALRGRGRQRITRGGGQREKLGDKRHIFRRRRGRRQQRFELVELRFDGIFALEAGGAFELGDKGMERAVLMMGRREIAQPGVFLAFNPVAQGGGETRLADPGLATDQHHLPFASGGTAPAAQKKLDLLLPLDERGQRRRAQRLEPAQNAAFTNDAPGALRLGETRELLRSEILDLEERTDLPPRTVTNHECARLGQRLQPGGEVRGLADHSAFLRRTRADQISDHNEAAGDAKPHAQRFRCCQRVDCVDDGEPRSHRPFGVVLMRLRIAEIDQHPVTHVLGDKAGVLADGVGDTAVIGADQFPQILWIKPCRECRRADEIGKHHRQLAPFGVGGSRCIRGRGRHCGAERRDAERGDGIQ